MVEASQPAGVAMATGWHLLGTAGAQRKACSSGQWNRQLSEYMLMDCVGARMAAGIWGRNGMHARQEKWTYHDGKACALRCGRVRVCI